MSRRPAFGARRGRLGAARAGVALALVAPLLWFVAVWFLRGGTKEGLLPALVDGVLRGVLDLLVHALGHPLQALLYVLVVAAASRFAFGR